ncbi:MAG TPA: signal peptidase I [Thermoanaerobaculia bacterium]|nr:signal peptidase I [Thermoanaerobaculia bacterium]
METDAKVKPRKPWLAAVLTLLLPGLGHLYGGEPVRALAVSVAQLALVAGAFASGVFRTFSGLVISLLVLLLVFVWVILDAVRIALRKKDYVLKRYNRWYVYGAALVLMNFFVSPAALVALSPVRTYKIVSGSMEPSLLINDHVVADLRHYRTARPMRGDLVVFTSPENPNAQVISRIVGLEGERIEILDKVVYIDGKPLEDPWGQHKDPQIYHGGPDPSLDDSQRIRVQRDNLISQEIPPETFFVLGDNRDYSYDSRFYGPIHPSLFQGRLLYIYLSDEASRIGMSLH